MSKLPDIPNSDALSRVIIRSAPRLHFDERLLALIVENMRRFDEETRKSLYRVLGSETMKYNG